jgi:hemerythrin
MTGGSRTREDNMAIFTWEDRFLTRVLQIDQHHLHLVKLLNNLHEDFINHASIDRLNALFFELIDYATYHFSAEEHLMQEHGYPATTAHKREHVLFAEEVAEIHANHLKRQHPLFLEILVFLQNWLTAHILQSDVVLGRFLASKALGEPQPKRTNSDNN